jgi:dTDP-4-dehydrorhamnose reductase
MRIAVTGAAGQLGREICQMLGPQALPLEIDTLDLTDRKAVLLHLPEMKPDAVINCAAYTAVDQAEHEAGRCFAANAMAVEYLAEACAQLQCPLLQVSTDYVYSGADGRRVPYREQDEPAPQGAYARSKLAGEQAAARHEKHLVVRTCGLYARPSHAEARNFVKTIVRLARSKPKLRVVADQHCTPSYVPHVARAMLFLLGIREDGNGLSPAPWGIYHVTNRGAATWHAVAEEIVRLANLETEVEAITTAEYGPAAPRPAYSVLDTSAYQRLGGPPMPDWQAALAEYFAELQ